MKPSDSLQDFAYEEIKKRIQNGEYAPGTKLNTQKYPIHWASAAPLSLLQSTA